MSIVHYSQASFSKKVALYDKSMVIFPKVQGPSRYVLWSPLSVHLNGSLGCQGFLGKVKQLAVERVEGELRAQGLGEGRERIKAVAIFWATRGALPPARLLMMILGLTPASNAFLEISTVWFNMLSWSIPSTNLSKG